MKLIDIKEFMDQKVAPMAWQRVQLRLLPEFNKRGIYLHKFDEEYICEEEFFLLINQTLDSLYKTTIPSN